MLAGGPASPAHKGSRLHYMSGHAHARSKIKNAQRRKARPFKSRRHSTNAYQPSSAWYGALEATTGLSLSCLEWHIPWTRSSTATYQQDRGSPAPWFPGTTRLTALTEAAQKGYLWRSLRLL